MSRTRTEGDKNVASRFEERTGNSKKQATRKNDRIVTSKKRKFDGDKSEQPAKKLNSNTTPAVRPEQTTFDATIATTSPEDLAVKYKDAIKKHKGDLSTIELEDMSLPASVFEDTTKFDQPRVVKNLPAFLQKFTPGGEKELSTCKAVASPHTLILTSSAIRSTDLARAVREYGTETNKIAKLFAKHQKLNEQLKYVGKTSFGIGAGNPNRIKDLIEADALKLDHLVRVVVDASYIDEKQNTIFNDRQSFDHLLSLLNSEKLNFRLHSRSTTVIVF